MGILVNSSCAVDFCFDSEHVIVLKETAQKAADDFLDKFFVRPCLMVVCTTGRQRRGIDMICSITNTAFLFSHPNLQLKKSKRVE